MPPTVAAGRVALTPLAGVSAAAITVAVVINPNTTHVPLCPFQAVTGLYCPLCGGLRAMHALSRGAMTTALHDNAGVIVALVVGAPVLMALQRLSPVRRRRAARYAVAVLVSAAVAFAVVRNLPFATALRPA